MARPPLAERLRPQKLGEFAGQKHLLGEGRFLNTLLKAENQNSLPSMLFWGPPGCGKTTLAKLLAQATHYDMVSLNAVSDGVRELRDVFERAESALQPVLLFVDEIHRFKNSQQDALLAAVERGDITFIGATTENPSFYLNRALLSRLRILQLRPLEEADFLELIQRALSDREIGLGNYPLAIGEDFKFKLIQSSGGDARVLLNTLEQAALRCQQRASRILEDEDLAEALQTTVPHYDRSGENHYDFVTALHKSIRNSNPDAALYYLARMIEGGEDPLFIIRRLVRAAAEDIGLADPQALTLSVSAKDAIEHLGMPESDVILAQVVIYLALAPKSNSCYLAMKQAKSLAKDFPTEPVPLHLRNAVTSLMSDVGYGKKYEYDHDWPDNVSPMETMPDSLIGKKIYKPQEWGFEKEIKKRLDFYTRAREKAQKKEV